MSSLVSDISSLDPLASGFKEQDFVGEKERVEFSQFNTFFLILVVFSVIGFLVLPLPKFVLMFAMIGGVGGALLLPMEYAIFALFSYLLFDGFFKLVTAYHPLAHVGQDIVLLVIFWRSLTHARSGGINKFATLPHIGVISVFTIWIFMQYLNPFGLGLIPSIAGSKVYLSPIAVYFIAYHHLDARARKNSVYFLVGLATFEGIFATLEYLFFPEIIFNLSQGDGVSYSSISKEVFKGALYRPMGTCSLPGAPSVWINLMAPFATYLLMKTGEGIKVRLMSVCFFIFGIPTLIFSQVRISVILALLGVLAVSVYPKRNWKKNLSITFITLVTTIAVVMSYLNKKISDLNLSEEAIVAALKGNTEGDEETGVISTGKMVALQSRMSTLGKSETFVNARQSSWDKIMLLAQEMPFGIGLSRVSAAAGPWMDLIKKDSYFGIIWVFTDNLVRAIFTELGVFGVLMWFFMVGTVIISLFIKSIININPDQGFLVWVCCVGPFVILLGGLDTEAILYAPVSSLFWFMLGIGMKEANHVKRI